MSNWETQIQDHIADGVLSYCVYYGTGRSMTADELSKYDIVITTYQTVVGEHVDAPAKMESDGPSKKKAKIERSLFKIKWKVIHHNILVCTAYNLFFSCSGLYSMKGITFVIPKLKWRRRYADWQPRGDGSNQGRRL